MLISMVHKHWPHFTPISSETKTKIFNLLSRSSQEIHKLSLLKSQFSFILFLMSSLLRTDALINTTKIIIQIDEIKTKLYKMQAQIFFFFFFIVLQLQLSPFHHLVALPCPIQSPLPKTTPSPLSLSMVPLYMFCFFPPLPPSCLPSGPCQFVLYFHVSGSILFICCMAKENISKIKREPTIWENIFANDILDKGLISKIYKELT